MIIKVAELSNLNLIATRNICVWIKARIAELKTISPSESSFELDFSEINFISPAATQGLLACLDELRQEFQLSVQMINLAPQIQANFELIKEMRYKHKESRPDLAPVSVSNAEMEQWIDI